MKNYWSSSLFLVIILNGSTKSRQTPTEGLTCVNDYLMNISCLWRNSSDFSGQRCELAGFWGIKSYEEEQRKPGASMCQLIPLSGQPHVSRSCFLSFDKSNFFYLHKIWLTVFCNGSAVTILHYHPAKHIKTQPPDKPLVRGNNISWTTGSNFPKYIEDYEFQLQYKATNASWETEALTGVIHGSSVELEDHVLAPGVEYQARVRVKPTEHRDDDHLEGEWSNWSPVVSWRTESRKLATSKETNTPSVIDSRGVVSIICLNLLLVLAVLCVIIYKAKNSSRLLKHTGQHVPDPSKYFQPLHSIHDGNFQKWLGGRNSISPFLTPQACEDFSPLQVSDKWNTSMMAPGARLSTAILVHSSQVDSGLENSGTSHGDSSGFSNVGYFYSKSPSGSLYVESCPVYFSYHPEESISSSIVSPASSCHSLLSPNDHTMSPDSGFHIPRDDHCEEEKNHKEEVEKEVPLVSFLLSSGAEGLAPVPDLSPWNDLGRAVSGWSISESDQGAMIRPSSMIEPCVGGYLTLKEMQKYSNKSI
ncbi:hypothetical protein DNTS_020688 [Danionella cerebrum]|uniref:Interleukin-2 receptor subunit beta n=1 Tax=Danionella cerebrum TaxID=2873325 RepID=A0A553MP15_9TELE|nr:hypothetical protein DNTS_020688 [Danionella translucida]